MAAAADSPGHASFTELYEKQMEDLSMVKFGPEVGAAVPNMPIRKLEQAYPAKQFHQPGHWPAGERVSALHLPPAAAGAEVAMTFWLNGRPTVIKQGQVDPSISLHDLLRQHSRLTGTKKVCNQGGCGSCTVAVSRWSTELGKPVFSSANACLLPVGTLNGLAITTTEGLGSCQSGLHPVQQRVADFNGSQCGYCTPGMVMALYSKLKTLEPSLPDDNDLQHTIDGNICRCTGYIPLANALGSFAKGGAERNAKLCYSKRGVVAPYDPSSDDPAVELPESAPEPSVVAGNGKVWHRPASLEEAGRLLNGEGVQLVAGNTGLKGLYPTDTAGKSVFVDVSQVKEMHAVQLLDGPSLEVGAAKAIETLAALLDMDERGSHAVLSPIVTQLKALPSDVQLNLKRMAQQAYNIAGVHVRNRATLGGNMALSKIKPEHFPSDLAGQFLAVGVTLKLLNTATGESYEKELAVWLKEGIDASELIVSLCIPIPSGVYLNQRSMLRSQNCHAYLSSAMTAVVSSGSLQCVRIAVGALPQAMLAPKTAAALEGKSAAQLLEGDWSAIAAILTKEIEFTDQHDLEYRKTLLHTFLYKFLLSLSQSGKTDPYCVLPRVLPKSNDVSFINKEHGDAIGKDLIPKHTSWAQASGEIKYAGDVEMGSGGLSAFMVTSTVAHGMLEGVDASKALEMEGVVAYLDAADIPGLNTVTTFPRREPLFASEHITYLGQPIGMIVAETSWQAEAAAKEVQRTLQIRALPAVMTIDQAIEKGQFLSGGEVAKKETKEGVSQSVLETETPNTVRFSGEFQSGQTKHFYLERQVAMATPRTNEHGGGDGVDLWNACQMPSLVQSAVAGMLGVSNAWVQVRQHMVGGGFGGKATRNVPTACAAALAAVRLNRPVRLVQDICTDLSMNGGRHPVKFHYDARVDKETGKLLAAHLSSHGGQAYIPDLLGTSDNHVGKAVLNPWANYSAPPHVITESKCCVLNIPPSTACRGPTDPKKSMAVETILQHAAAAADLPFYAVQKANMNPALDGGVQPKLWDELESSSALQQRMTDVKAFNQANKLKKRGIALAPCLWNTPPIPSTCTVAICHGGGITPPDGSIAITLGSAEIGQGLHTKVAQACQHVLSQHPLLSEDVPLRLIRVIGNNTEVVPAFDLVGGSGSNPQAVRAVTGACEQLLEKLTVHMTMNPLKKKTMTFNRQAMGLDGKKMTWPELVATVTGPFGLAGADLVARNTVCFGINNNEMVLKQMIQGKMAGPHPSHGAAVTEVEMDVLTGEHVILRTDLLYSQPRSVNPVIDLGQIQGAFVMGLGFFMREYTEYNREGTHLITGDTWEYKPPQLQDIPQVFNMAYFRQGSTKNLVYGAKGVGEPPLFMAVSVVNAMRECIMSARADAGLAPWADVSLPVTPARASTACAIDASKLGPDSSLWNSIENAYLNGYCSGAGDHTAPDAKKSHQIEKTSSMPSSLAVGSVVGAGIALAGAFLVARHYIKK